MRGQIGETTQQARQNHAGGEVEASRERECGPEQTADDGGRDGLARRVTVGDHVLSLGTQSKKAVSGRQASSRSTAVNTP